MQGGEESAGCKSDPAAQDNFVRIKNADDH